MSTGPIADDLSFEVGLTYLGYVEAQFLRLARAYDLMALVGGGWITAADLSLLPGETLARADYFHNATKERVVRIHSSICHVILHERSLVIRAAAPDADAAEAALGVIAAALPAISPTNRDAPARFWWWSPQGTRDLARTMPTPLWSEIRGNYVGATQTQLDELVAWRRPPGGGRLLLWHGDPGTGKTNAIRSLTGEWRDWAEFQFVTDPEEFLRNPGYLLAAIAEARRPPAGGLQDPWKVVVLEDAGEFLAADARHLKGQALSRLLNVCDGVLGQAMRALILATTNEPLGQLHPALVRPGRCLANIRFERFDRNQIQAWCAARSAAAPEAHAAALAELYAHLDGRPLPQPRPPIGFARENAA